MQDSRDESIVAARRSPRILRSPQPAARNPQPATRNSQLATRNSQLADTRQAPD